MWSQNLKKVLLIYCMQFYSPLLQYTILHFSSFEQFRQHGLYIHIKKIPDTTNRQHWITSKCYSNRISANFDESSGGVGRYYCSWSSMSHTQRINEPQISGKIDDQIDDSKLAIDLFVSQLSVSFSCELSQQNFKSKYNLNKEQWLPLL